MDPSALHGAVLWKYHAVHHSSEELDWISAARFHPVNLFLVGSLVDVALLLAGISPNVMLWLGPFTTAHSAFVHANLKWTLGPFKYVLASPVFHRWHHTALETRRNKNFAGTFPVLDLLFGTFYMPKNVLPDAYGIDDRRFPGKLRQRRSSIRSRAVNGETAAAFGRILLCSSFISLQSTRQGGPYVRSGPCCVCSVLESAMSAVSRPLLAPYAAACRLALALPSPPHRRMPTTSPSMSTGAHHELPDRVATIVIGNPLIADATLQNGGILVLTGKGYGSTNLLALDRQGQVLMSKTVRVTGPSADHLVVVYRGIDRESYSCPPDASRASRSATCPLSSAARSCAGRQRAAAGGHAARSERG